MGLFMRYLEFNNKSEFDEWEKRQRVRLGLPLIGVNQSEGKPQPTKQQTVRYTDSIDHPTNNKVICIIDDKADKESRSEFDGDEAKKRGWKEDSPNTRPREERETGPITLPPTPRV
jgi:hypothetical protein